MKFAAIDIGSNAVRLLIVSAKKRKGNLIIRKVSFTRVPLRLGDDVFETGLISDKKAKNLVKVMRAFWYLMDVFGIDKFYAYATSAMRSAQNREQVVEKVLREANVNIEVIDGEREADLIFKNFSSGDFAVENDYLFIDLGGGSMELTLIREGKRLRSQSFKIGTIRAMKSAIEDGEWQAVEEFVKHVSDGSRSLVAIGSGGNINRLHKLVGTPKKDPVIIERLEWMHHKLSNLSFNERVEKYGLKLDRADVIVPAAEIYIKVMKRAGADEILVPRVGLSDGMILELIEKFSDEF